ncbi:MAG: peptidase [Candidatus Saccharibacteria bacterium]|nr:peptidase [Candidatus Saccharibacteria bacterium]
MVQTSTLPDDDLAGNADDSRNLGQQAYNDEVGAKPLDEDERAKLAEIEQNYGNSGGSDEGAPESLENATPEQQREAIAEQEEAGDEESLYSASEETTSAAGGKGKESFGAKLLAGSKRFGPSGGIIGLLVGGAGFSSVLLAPGSLLVALEKAVTNDSSDSTRTNIVFRRAYVAKQFSKDKSRGTTKLESDLTSVSADEAARYTQDGYKINLSPEGTIDSLEFPDHHTVTDGAEYTDYAENTTEGRRATSNVLDVRSAFFENQAFKDTLGRYEIVKGDRLTPSDDPDPAKRKEAIDKSFDENTKLNETPGDASDPKVIDVREKALTSDTIGDDSGTKLKPQVDRITGDIAAKAGAAALVTAPVSVGCAVYNVAKLTNATIKAKWVYDLISFAYPFVRAAAQIEDQGNIEPSVVEDLANRLTTPDSGGKTAMDSQALQMAIYGDFTGLTDMAKKYTSWGWEQQVDSAASLIVNNVRDVFGKDGIKDICRGASYVQAGGIIACVNDPVAAVFCAAGAVLAPIAEHFLLPVLVAQLAKPALHYLATVDLSSALNGEGLGDAIGVGIGWLLSNSTLGAGMVVAGGAGGLDAVKNFISKTDTPYFNTTTQLAIDQAKGDPWNVNNQYSFMGQISSMLNPYPTTDGTLFSKLASMTTVVNTTIANIPGVTAHALFSQPSNMTLQDALGGDAAAIRTGKC